MESVAGRSLEAAALSVRRRPTSVLLARMPVHLSQPRALTGPSLHIRTFAAVAGSPRTNHMVGRDEGQRL